MAKLRPHKQTKLHDNKSRISVSIYGDVSCPRSNKSHNHTTRNNGNKRHRHTINFSTISKLCLSVLSVIITAPVSAETVGGVSATASPIANSSGSVTNQAIQVLQGPYITNTYGNGIQCQGPTLNFTPYVTGSTSIQRPYEGEWFDNVYDMRDLLGSTDANGNATGDGAPDNPGSVLYQVPVRTGQKDNHSLSIGFSATWSKPLDKKLQQLCKDAATTQIAYSQQLTANKRLDFEIARLKNCGELMKAGIMFHKNSPYYAVCADVVLVNPPGVLPDHTHTIPSNDASLLKEISIGNN